MKMQTEELSLGRTLIALREALGMSQKDLADALGIPEGQVARDERNEYRGLSRRSAERLLAVFDLIETRARSVETLLQEAH